MSRKTKAPGIIDENMAESLLGGVSPYCDYLRDLSFYNLLKNSNPESPVAYRICYAFEQNGHIYSGDKIKFPTKKLPNNQKTYSWKPGTEAPPPEPGDWQALTKLFEKRLENYKSIPEPTVSFKNIEILAKSLSLDELNIDVLKFLYLYGQDFSLSSFAGDFIGGYSPRMAPAIARFLDRPKDVAKIAQILDPRSPLMSYGLIGLMEDQGDDEDKCQFPIIEDNINILLGIPNLSPDAIVEELIGKPLESDLTTDDFSYLEEDIDQIVRIVKKAVAKGTEGVNILLYGPAGSGKTALSQALAKRLGLTLYAVGENEDNQNNEPGQGSSKQRVGRLFQAHAFLKGRKDAALLLFDEVEDLLLKGTDAEKKAEPPSKIIVNRLLENNPVVTIWAGNDPDKFHESLRQRFSYSVYVDYPPTELRKKIWRKQLALNDAKMPEKEISYLARHYMAPARMIANAVEHANEDGKIEIKELERIMLSSSRLTYGDSEHIVHRGGVSEKFDLELVNYDTALQNEMGAIIDAANKTAPYALFMQGQPGSGLRSFGRFLAEKAILNQEELDIAALIAPGPFSNPVKNIQKAFEASRDEKTLLVFSNMDAFSSSPESKSSDWKESLAPLFMRCVLDHPMPIIAHSYKIDVEFPDFMTKGFSMKTKIQPLTQELSTKAFKIYFNRPMEEDQTFPDNLVPGDFANAEKVLRKSTNGHTSPTGIMETLEEQRTHRVNAGGMKIGFK